MATHKYIYWRNDLLPQNQRGPNKQAVDDVPDPLPAKQFANIHILVGYCPQTIKEFQEIAKKLRQTFPDATDDKIECGRVSTSMHVRGFTIISYGAEIPRLGVNYKSQGWFEYEHARMEYYW